jgi:fatty-acyl-CoA synthase
LPVRNLFDVEALERTPLAERNLPPSTYALLRASAELYGDRPAIRFLPNGLPDDPVRDMSYRELFARVTQAANLFHELGVGPETSVSMLLPLTPETFVVLIGAQTAGLANPINPMLEPAQIATLLAEARCRILVAPDPDLLPGFWPKVEATLALAPFVEHVLRIGGPASRDASAPSLEAELDRRPADRLTFAREIRPETTAALFHTGGTTALPKLARHTHGGLVLHAFAMVEMLDLRPATNVFNGLPIFHVGGACCAGLTPLSLGMTIVLMTPAGFRNPNVVKNIWALVERLRPDMLGMVPTSWGAVMNVPSDGFDLTSLRVLNAGASTMPLEVAHAVERRLGLAVCEGWGMTELHGFGALTPRAGENRIGSVGLRTPYTELIAASVKDGRLNARLKAGEIGKVLVRGPQLFAGYLNEAHNVGAWVEPAEGDSNGAKWFDTGDLGRIDEDGYVWLTGRAKDLIIRSAHNIDPLMIEEAFYRHRAVELVAAVGRPDIYAGEIPIAFVQLKAGARAEAGELQDFARQHIPERAAAPAEVHILPLMPLTGVGKIFKPALREIAAKRALELALANLPAAHGGFAVSVAAHPKFGSLATVTFEAPLDAAQAEAIRALLGKFQIKTELKVPVVG